MRTNVFLLKSALKIIVLALLLFCILVGLIWINYRFVLENPGGNDFLARWMGARYWVREGVSPYSPEVSLASQKMIYGRAADISKGEDIEHFVYPFPSMIFFAPFGFLDYPLARTAWMVLIELILFAFCLICIELSDFPKTVVEKMIYILFGILWYPAIRTLILGQFAAINAFLIILSILLLVKKKDIPSGIVLSFTLIKPQMSYLIVPFILYWAISKKQYKVLVGFAGSFILVLGFSLIILPDWPYQMAWQLAEYPAYTIRVGSTLHAIVRLVPLKIPYLYSFLAFTGYICLVVAWLKIWGKNEQYFIWTAFLTLVITNIIAFRTATTHYILLLPVVFSLSKTLKERLSHLGTLLGMVNILVLLVGFWLLFIYSVAGNVESEIMYPPLPLYCLIGLIWSRWWMVKGSENTTLGKRRFS